MLKRDFKAPLREACLVDITFQIALGIGQPINQFHYVPLKQLCSLVVCIIESVSIHTGLVKLGSARVQDHWKHHDSIIEYELDHPTPSTTHIRSNANFNLNQHNVQRYVQDDIERVVMCSKKRIRLLHSSRSEKHFDEFKLSKALM